MSLAKWFDFTNRGYIDKYPSLFEEYIPIKELYLDECAEDFMEERLRYYGARTGRFETTIINFLRDATFVNRINTSLKETHEAVKQVLAKKKKSWRGFIPI